MEQRKGKTIFPHKNWSSLDWTILGWDYNSYLLKDTKEIIQPLLVNGKYLKHFFC
jgi:hypothetical protein